jgi:hypothetical protein
MPARRLPEAFRSLPRPSSFASAKALAVCPYYLERPFSFSSGRGQISLHSHKPKPSLRDVLAIAGFLPNTFRQRVLEFFFVN